MTPRATLRTSHEDPAVIAAALEPDNTEEMSTRADPTEGTVVTTIERETTGGLRTSVDDYVANLTVAQRTTDTTTQS